MCGLKHVRFAGAREAESHGGAGVEGEAGAGGEAAAEGEGGDAGGGEYVEAQVGEYTKEKLLELQRNTKTVGAAKPVVDSMPAEPVVVLKGLLKPVEEPKGVVEMKVGGVFVESELQEGLGRWRRLPRGWSMMRRGG